MRSLRIYSFTSKHIRTVVPFQVEGKVMVSSLLADVDFIEELRLRRWAREHYVPRTLRQISWHPIVHDEMERKEEEAGDTETSPEYAWAAR
jgi:hypothetical protein